MAKKNKIDLWSLIIFGVLVVSLIMVIVGVCIAWTSTTVTLLSKDSVSTTTLAKWAESNSKVEDGIDGFGAMAAFAYITLALAALTAILFVVSKFVNVKIMKWALLAVSALLVVSAIITIALTYSFGGKLSNSDLGEFASGKTAPAAGAWLASIFGIVGGAAGSVGALKK